MSLMQTILQGFSPGGVQGFQGRQLQQQQQQAEIDNEKQLTQQRAEKVDQDAFQHAMTEGYLPVGPGGVVRRPYYPGIDNSTTGAAAPTGNGPTGEDTDAPTSPKPGQQPQGTYIDKADSARVIKHTDRNGDTVQWEIPTPAEQHQRQIQQAYADAMNPQAQATQTQQQTVVGQGREAETQGTAAGVTAGKIADAKARGMQVPDDLADQYGIPRGSIRTQDQIDALTEKFNTVRGANVRTEGANTRQAASIAAKASGVKATHVTVGAGGTQNLLTVYNNGETEETPMDAKAAVKPTAAGRGGALTAGQQGVQNRFLAKQQELQAQKHEALQTKEGDLWSQKQAYADAAQIPDGQPVIDPGNPRAQPTPMNAAWRTIFTGKMKKAESDAMQAQKGAALIRKQNGWGDQGAQPQTAGAAAGAGATAQPQPGAAGAQPAGGAPAGAPVGAGATQVTAPVQKVHVKTKTGMGYIPKANLAAAQKLDPTLQVIP
jgi:hypothetical protein